jgi:ribose transport system substrate-binding protein
MEISKLIDRDSEVVIMSYLKGSLTAIEREKRVKRSLEKAGIRQSYDTLYCENTKVRAYVITKNLIKKNPKINGIVNINGPNL